MIKALWLCKMSELYRDAPGIIQGEMAGCLDSLEQVIKKRKAMATKSTLVKRIMDICYIHHTILFLCMFESFYHKTFKECISLKNLEKHFHSELEENNYI